MAEKAGVVSVRTERAPSRLLLPLIVTGFLAVMLAWLGLTQFLNALTLGAVYALIALGYTMVYGIIELINFAHGDIFMMGAFVSLWTLSAWPLPAPLDKLGLGDRKSTRLNSSHT